MFLRGSEIKDRQGFGRAGLILVLFAAVVVLAYAVYRLFLIPDPAVEGIDAFRLLPAEKTVTLQCRNLKSIEVSVYQNGKITGIMKDEVSGIAQKVYSLGIKPDDLGLSDGKGIVVVKAEAGPFKKVRHEVETVIDTRPPSLEVLRAPRFIYRGSGGIALLRAGGADSLHIRINNTLFPAFEAAGYREPSLSEEGAFSGTEGSSSAYVPKTYVAFFPAPFNIEDGSVYYAVAEDIAGNRSIRSLSTTFRDKGYRSSSINIDDAFIQTVVAPLLNRTSVDDPVGAFKKVNEEMRRESREKIFAIAEQTENRILWEGRFLQLKNSKVMATYGDERTYFYKGKKISESVHLGYDLASFARAPVGASNSGVVRFVGDLDIYGNAVIIDHGLGLMTLYGHLSEINVEKDRMVEKGDIIGKTGATGLAGGDHLHFGILIHGYEVSPLYWWDAGWISVNITDYINTVR